MRALATVTTKYKRAEEIGKESGGNDANIDESAMTQKQKERRAFR